MRRLTPGDVACWVLKTSRPPAEIAPGRRPGTEQELTRCVRPSYRLDLMDAGQPCLLWLSGRRQPGVHALGVLADPDARDAEVLRMPRGSNPSWLSRAQFHVVLARVPDRGAATGLGPWSP
ncbi:MAG: hypothetical protein ACJ71Y_09015 [Blastococcus sp.]